MQCKMYLQLFFQVQVQDGILDPISIDREKTLMDIVFDKVAVRK